MGAVVVFQREETPWPARLADAVFRRRDEPSKCEHLALLTLHVVQPGQTVLGAEVVHLKPELVQGVARNVDPHNFTLLVQQVHGSPRLAFWDRRLGNVHGPVFPSEKGRLGAVGRFLSCGSEFDRQFHEWAVLVVRREELGTVKPKAVKPTPQRQGLEHTLVAVFEVDTGGEVEKRRIRCAFPAFHNGNHRAFTHTSHGAQPKSNGTFLVDGELERRFVHVWPQHRNPLATGLFHEVGDLLDVIHVVGQLGRHEFRRVVRLEVGGLVSHPCVARGVRLVEGVRGKGFPVGPNLLQTLSVVAIRLATLQEIGLHLVDDVLLLLAHRLPKAVGLALREACKFLTQQHHLLLVHRDAVRLFEVLLARVQIVGDGLAAVLARHKVRDVFHRTRAVQGVHGDQILKHRRLQRLQVLLHAGRFVLEDADGVAALEQLVRLGVVQWERIWVEVQSVPELDVLHGVLDDREGFQPQEIHLQQPGVLGHRVVELGARHGAVLGRGHRNEIGDVVGRDDDATGVDAGVPHAALQNAGGLKGLALKRGLLADRLELLHHGKTLAPHLFFQGFVVEREHLLQGDVGNQFGQPVGVAKWQLHHPGCVPNGRLRGHGAVGDDLGHLVGAVFVNDIVDDPPSSLVVKINVDVGQAHTVRIEEPLEQQIVLDGVHIRDAHAVGHRRSRGRPTTGSHAHPHFACGGREILNNEEIARVPRALDGFQFEVQAFLDLRGDFSVPFFSPQVGDVTQVGVFATLAAVLSVFRMHKFFRNVERRKQHVTLQHIAFTLVHQRGDVGHGLGHVREQRLHLRRRFQIKAVVGEAKPEFAATLADVALGLTHVSRILDAQQNVVGVALVLARVVAVVARHQTDAVLGRHLLKEVVHHGLLLQPVSVQFGVEIIPHQAFPPHKSLFRLILTDVEHQRRHLSEQASCQDDKVFLEFLHEGPVDSWHVVEAIRVGLGRKFGQVVVTVLVLGQKHCRVSVVFFGLVVHVVAHIQLRPHDGLDALLVARPHELKSRHHVPMVRHRQGRHAHLLRGSNEFTYRAHRLEHAEL